MWTLPSHATRELTQCVWCGGYWPGKVSEWMALSPESSHRKLCLVLTCTEIQWRLGRRNRLLLRECDQEEVSGLIDRASSQVHCCLARGVRLVWEGASDVCSSLRKSAAPRKPLISSFQGSGHQVGWRHHWVDLSSSTNTWAKGKKVERK